MKLLIPILVVLFSVGIISSVHGQEDSQLPDWVKNIFVWYAGDEISEAELLQAIQYLVKEEIIIIPNFGECSEGTELVNGVCQIIEIEEPESVSKPILYGPQEYRCIDDSPFFNLENHSGFHLENFEDNKVDDGIFYENGFINTPRNEEKDKTDSVDCDDGRLDERGVDGHSFNLGGDKNFLFFTFDENILGSLPTKAGVVLTDNTHNDGVVDILFTVFDADEIAVGSIGPIPLDIGKNGQISGDRFFGAAYDDGIKSISLSVIKGSIEVDHLQFFIEN